MVNFSNGAPKRIEDHYFDCLTDNYPGLFAAMIYCSISSARISWSDPSTAWPNAIN